ncbi:hypothetical protein [Hydrogenophaga sp.]|uniref:hypothetical protein n=1 Tax=Hydrogenophaga sp. TaxID=1904254 RepID=UPI003F6FD60A
MTFLNLCAQSRFPGQRRDGWRSRGRVVFALNQMQKTCRAQKLRHETSHDFPRAACWPKKVFSKETSMHPFAGSWVLWAVVALAAVAIIALIGWGIVWMLALSD